MKVKFLGPFTTVEGLEEAANALGEVGSASFNVKHNEKINMPEYYAAVTYVPGKNITATGPETTVTVSGIIPETIEVKKEDPVVEKVGKNQKKTKKKSGKKGKKK